MRKVPVTIVTGFLGVGKTTQVHKSQQTQLTIYLKGLFSKCSFLTENSLSMTLYKNVINGTYVDH